MSGIFISYRRDDSQGWASHLAETLKAEFSADQVFMDIGGIEPGEDFVKRIEKTVSTCDALVALLGPRWLNATDAEGRRRLDDPNDFVRMEIAAALARDVPVIPILLGGARMPPDNSLPEDLKGISRRQALEVTDSRWSFDTDQLISTLEKLVKRAPQRQGRRASQEKKQSNRRISVGKGLIIKRSRCGDIAGIVSDGTASLQASAQQISVAQEATIEDSKVGNIVAVKKKRDHPRGKP